MTDSDAAAVRVRFCPSPTGSPHVGLARTALFNWAFARHHGGTFVFRIEDTDAARDSQESYDTLLEVMRWLGFDWDEGPEVGGPHGPYRQSERYDTYADVARRLHEGGRAYHCYCSSEEIDERNAKARSEGRAPGYDGQCRSLTAEQVAGYVAEGRKPVLRFRMPDEPITFTDLVRGDISFQPENVPDYVLVRANGHPLYTLVNPVDDALMQITHVLRGEDLLSSTPRQIALYAALRDVGVTDAATPRFGHLPYVMGQGNKKLSKRDPEANLLGYRERGFVPEGLLNYLALLGWAISEDNDIFTMAEMVAAFRLERVNPNPARFDLKKAEAINAAHLRTLDVDDLATRLVPYLQAAEVLPEQVTHDQQALLRRATPLVQERMTVLGEAVDMLGFLFVDEDSFSRDPADADKLLDENGRAVVKAASAALADLPTWDTPSIEEALRRALVEDMGLKPRHAFGPVRVAITGRRVSPPLFESMELLGRERSLNRLAGAQEG
ncbi:MAG: glutamate--tRNA ligase [Nocardioidaceae bacterium]|nr:glutamate--tRNA ligase [Nocardioidaceae bacterium]NUS51784.1 glutamate--tRNA ligase [Nocardioidaceae bacterium]